MVEVATKFLVILGKFCIVQCHIYLSYTRKISQYVYSVAISWLCTLSGFSYLKFVDHWHAIQKIFVLDHMATKGVD